MGLVTRDGYPIAANKVPCRACPWRREQGGRHDDSLPSALLEGVSWGCHTSGVTPSGDALRICAGWLCSEDAKSERIVRFARDNGWIPNQDEQRQHAREAGIELFTDYRAVLARKESP